MTLTEADGTTVPSGDIAVSNASSTVLQLTLNPGATVVGPLKASVSLGGGITSGTAVQVGTVMPTIDSNLDQLPADPTDTTKVFIVGTGFSTTVGNDSVTFNDGAVGTIDDTSPYQPTATMLTVEFNQPGDILPATAGALDAVVSVVPTNGSNVAIGDPIGSGTAAQVAAILPKITSSASDLDADAATITINGFGFDPSSFVTHDLVTFTNAAGASDGAGTVSAATPTSLTVTFTTYPTIAGPLMAKVAVNGDSSGTPLQVATVLPVVVASPLTSVTAAATNSVTLGITGYGFDETTFTDNTVTFGDGSGGTSGLVTNVTGAPAR